MIKGYPTDEREPSNSWEVCYILSLRKPWYKTGVTKEEVEPMIEPARRREIKQWAREFFTHEWAMLHMGFKVRPSISYYNRHPYF